MHDKDIYLLRHGDTGLNKRYVGSSNVSLSPKGIEEVKKVVLISRWLILTLSYVVR